MTHFQLLLRLSPLLTLGLTYPWLVAHTDPGCDLKANRTYIVQRGDSLSLIALKCFGTAGKGAELGRFNRISRPNHLIVGQALEVPSGWNRIDVKTSASLELAHWRKHFQLSGEAKVPPTLQPKPTPISEVKSNQEMAVLEAQKDQSPEKGLEVTRNLLKEEPTLVSARIAEIKLLMKAGRKSEAQGRARALVSAHPELKNVPKIREWANLKDDSSKKSSEAPAEELAK
jgi:hypothetical protein